MCFVNEGLRALDSKLSGRMESSVQEPYIMDNITIAYQECIDAFSSIHKQRAIRRILAHEETGIYKMAWNHIIPPYAALLLSLQCLDNIRKLQLLRPRQTCSKMVPKGGCGIH